MVAMGRARGAMSAKGAVAGLVVAAAVFVPGAALAACGQAIGILDMQVSLIAQAEPLAADPAAPLGSGDRLITLAKPELARRTSKAFDVFADGTAPSGKPPVVESDLAAARKALGDARQALERGDEAACQEAVSAGLLAAQGARAAFR